MYSEPLIQAIQISANTIANSTIARTVTSSARWCAACPITAT